MVQMLQQTSLKLSNEMNFRTNILLLFLWTGWAGFLSACVETDNSYCYKEGYSTSDDYCTYICVNGGWKAQCNNMELQNCLNNIAYDFDYCMSRTGANWHSYF